MQLVINTRGTLLRRRGERFSINAGTQSHEFSAKKLHSIVVSTGIRLTSDAIQLAVDHNIDIVFLDSQGNPSSRVWQSRLGSTATIRRKQLEASDQALGLTLAAGWIAKKLTNQLEFLNELKACRSGELAGEIGTAAARIENIRTKLDLIAADAIRELSGEDPLDQGDYTEICGQILGMEGSAGRVYFAAISKLLPSEYRFQGRSRRPAADPFNAMLNYAYGVLYSQVERALILAGLDPFIGFFHTDNYNKPSLVYDLIEPFRIIAERTTVLYFTGRRIKSEYFREVPGGGVELSPDGRAALITALNRRLDKTVSYPVQKSRVGKPGPPKHRNIKLRDTIRFESHSLANRLLGRHDIPQVVKSENLFSETEK